MAAPGEARAGLIWNAGTWTHTTLPSPTTGWGSNHNDGQTTVTISGVPVLITVQYTSHGTSTGLHTILGSPGRPSQTNASFTPDTTNPGVALGIGTSNDFNGASGSATLANLSVLSIRFQHALTLQAVPIVFLQDLVVGDVDRNSGTSWSDFLYARGFSGTSVVSSIATIPHPTPTVQAFDYQFAGASAAVSAALGVPTSSPFTLSGFVGRPSPNHDNSNLGGQRGNVNFNFSGAVDRLEIWFMQGPTGRGAAQHAIWVNSIPNAGLQALSSPVPEPGTLALAMAAPGFAGAAAIRSRSRSGSRARAVRRAGRARARGGAGGDAETSLFLDGRSPLLMNALE